MLFNSPLYGAFLVGTWAVFWLLGRRRAARARAVPRRRELRLLLLRHVGRRAGRARAAPPRRGGRCSASASSSSAARIDFFVGRALARTERPGGRNALLLVSIVYYLGVLAVFKYWNFAADSLASLFGRARRRTSTSTHLRLVLPFGISFFTFETMSYTIDVWRRELEPRRALPRLPALRLLLPAPRRRAHRAPARRCCRSSRATPRADAAMQARGLWRIATGLAKKIVIGDYLAQAHREPRLRHARALHRARSAPRRLRYAAQIYADFSGYSDVAHRQRRALRLRAARELRRPLPGAATSRSSGTAGTSRSAPGCATTCTSPSAARAGRSADVPQPDDHDGARGPAGTARRGTSSSGARSTGARSPSRGCGSGARVGRRARRRRPRRESSRRLATFHFVCFAWIFFRAPTFAHALARARSRSPGAAGRWSHVAPRVIPVLVGARPRSTSSRARIESARARGVRRAPRARAGPGPRGRRVRAAPRRLGPSRSPSCTGSSDALRAAPRPCSAWRTSLRRWSSRSASSAGCRRGGRPSTGSAAMLVAAHGLGRLRLLLGRTSWGRALRARTAAVSLAVGVALATTLALTASWLRGVYGPIGAGGAVLFALVAALAAAVPRRPPGRAGRLAVGRGAQAGGPPRVRRLALALGAWLAATGLAGAAVERTFTIAIDDAHPIAVVASVWSGGQIAARAVLEGRDDADPRLQAALEGHPDATLVHEAIVGAGPGGRPARPAPRHVVRPGRRRRRAHLRRAHRVRHSRRAARASGVRPGLQAAGARRDRGARPPCRVGDPRRPLRRPGSRPPRPRPAEPHPHPPHVPGSAARSRRDRRDPDRRGGSRRRPRRGALPRARRRRPTAASATSSTRPRTAPCPATTGPATRVPRTSSPRPPRSPETPSSPRRPCAPARLPARPRDRRLRREPLHRRRPRSSTSARRRSPSSRSPRSPGRPRPGLRRTPSRTSPVPPRAAAARRRVHAPVRSRSRAAPDRRAAPLLLGRGRARPLARASARSAIRRDLDAARRGARPPRRPRVELLREPLLLRRRALDLPGHGRPLGPVARSGRPSTSACAGTPTSGRLRYRAPARRPSTPTAPTGSAPSSPRASRPAASRARRRVATLDAAARKRASPRQSAPSWTASFAARLRCSCVISSAPRRATSWPTRPRC